jgi:hypothetical protein
MRLKSMLLQAQLRDQSTSALQAHQLDEPDRRTNLRLVSH